MVFRIVKFYLKFKKISFTNFQELSITDYKIELSALKCGFKEIPSKINFSQISSTLLSYTLKPKHLLWFSHSTARKFSITSGFSTPYIFRISLYTRLFHRNDFQLFVWTYISSKNIFYFLILVSSFKYFCVRVDTRQVGDKLAVFDELWAAEWTRALVWPNSVGFRRTVRRHSARDSRSR